MNKATSSRLATAMLVLGLSAVDLAPKLGVSNSLISRWQKGTRQIPTKGDSLHKLSEVLVQMDTEGELDELLAPYRSEGTKEQAMRRYLIDTDMPGLPLAKGPRPIPQSGEYVAEQRVLLGEKGFRKATLLMLDYVAKLPPGQELTICAHSGFELWHANLPFALQVLQKLSALLKRDIHLTLVTRNAEGFDGSHYFSVFWLTSQLKGIIRSRYYEGEAPDEYFVASIKGYWSARVEYDNTAEDDMISVLYTDPRNIKKDEIHVDEFLKRSTPAGQFGFLREPKGNVQNKRLWKRGSLPALDFPDASQPDGSFCAITSLPFFGIASKKERSVQCDENVLKTLPSYMFGTDKLLESAPYRIILCKEAVREGLAEESLRYDSLSEALGSEVTTTRDILTDQLKRLLTAMNKNPDFEVALMPRNAFEKLELEMMCWKDSVAVGWLQDGSESLFTIDPFTRTGFDNAFEHVWERLRKGWKRKKNTKATLRKWLAGKELEEDASEESSERSWELLPPQ